jgi:GST-like protein
MIDLYTVTTANGYKASIVLEELGLPYTAHKVDLMAGAHKQADFLKINPVGKVPAIVDRETASGKPIGVFETNAIALYLAEKAGGRLIPSDPDARAQMHAWMSVSASGLSAATAGVFFMGRAPEPIPYAVDFYKNSVRTIMTQIEAVLATRPYLAGDEYSLADAVMYPNLAVGVARMLPDAFEGLGHLKAWAEKVGDRPAVQRGLTVPNALPPIAA